MKKNWANDKVLKDLFAKFRRYRLAEQRANAAFEKKHGKPVFWACVVGATKEMQLDSSRIVDIVRKGDEVWLEMCKRVRQYGYASKHEPKTFKEYVALIEY